MRAKYGWGERRKQMEEIDANEDDGLKLTENITRTNKKHWLRYLDPNKNDMDAREKYVKSAATQSVDNSQVLDDIVDDNVFKALG